MEESTPVLIINSNIWANEVSMRKSNFNPDMESQMSDK